MKFMDGECIIMLTYNIVLLGVQAIIYVKCINSIQSIFTMKLHVVSLFMKSCWINGKLNSSVLDINLQLCIYIICIA